MTGSTSQRRLDHARLRAAQLVDVGGGRVIPLLKPVLSVGRGRGNDVVVHDASVSRRHARMERHDEGFVVIDLQSRKGTGVDGSQLSGGRALLRDGAELRLGDVVFRFHDLRTAVVCPDGGLPAVRDGWRQRLRRALFG